MFSIFKRKNNIPVDLSGLRTDMHSHILPGIDDGSPDRETSIQLIKGLQELGYSRFVATPHIMWDIHKNTADGIRQTQQILQQSITENKISTTVHSAAEYYLDEHFDTLLAGEQPLLTIKDNWVLVEWSFVTPPFDLREKLFAMQIKGYQPVLAHPERYNYLMQQKTLYDELKDAGCYFQLNLLSLTGYYGKPTLDLAHYLLKKKYIDLLGTDLHHHRHLHALQQGGAMMSTVNSLLDAGTLLNPNL